MKILLLAILYFIPMNMLFAQATDHDKKAAVMVLGTFHFAYPNLDVIKTEKKDQIDVMSPKRQEEIRALVDRLKAFRPTIVAIEYKTWNQALIDSQYKAYLQGHFELPRDEAYQLAFRLAKVSGLQKVHCIDAWGNIDFFYQTKDQKNYTVNPAREKVMEAFDRMEDSLLKAGKLSRQSHDSTKRPGYESMTAIFKRMNHPKILLADHQYYFGEKFRFEAEPFDYTGADWLALSWYSRNLRIFRNIQRITAKPGDRIFVLFGSGHAYLLNQFCNVSPEHYTVSPLRYLK